MEGKLQPENIIMDKPYKLLIKDMLRIKIGPVH